MIMKIIHINDKEKKFDIPTTKTIVVIDKYKDATKKTVSSRITKIQNEVKEIITDEKKLKEFLKQIESELERNPSISMKSIIKRANNTI